MAREVFCVKISKSIVFVLGSEGATQLTSSGEWGGGVNLVLSAISLGPILSFFPFPSNSQPILEYPPVIF